MISASDFRNGVTIEIDGNVCQIIEFQHVKPGKGAAFVRTKLKDIINGGVKETTFRPTEKFPTARIDRVVDYNGNIKQDASPELADIFRKIGRNSDAIHSATANFISKNAASLQESSVFTRNDRVAFLLKNSAKNKYNGYQYGSSASGLATYVEPEQFIELNKTRLFLENEKTEEVNRILREVSHHVGQYSELYMLDFDSLMKLDVIFAKAEYGFYKAGIIAEISKDNDLYLKDIVHPLIDPSVVVGNTYTLKEP